MRLSFMWRFCVTVCLLLVSPHVYAQQQCTTNELNLMCGSNQVLQGISASGVPKCVTAYCPSGKVLRGFDANGAVCGSMKWSDRCRDVTNSYSNSGYDFKCNSNEYLVGMTVSDEGEHSDFDKNNSSIKDYGSKVRMKGSGGWGRIVCCRDTTW